MTDIRKTLQTVIDASLACNKHEQGDYYVDNILFCGKCNTPKQAIKNFGELFNNQEIKVGILCRCETERRQAEAEARKKQDEADRISRLRANGLMDKSMKDYRFENSNGANSVLIDMAKRYVEHWDEMLANNMGLLFFGDTGNGKTFTAGCIANALIDKGVPVLVTSFPRLLNEITGMFGDDRNSYIASLRNFKLLVIDDLGAERQSQFALETVYSIIDERYKSRLPMIITTNLTETDIRQPQNMDYQRIYDRVIEMCTMVHFKGKNIRRQQADSKITRAREILFGGNRNSDTHNNR